MKTLISVVLDRSGSMEGRESDVVGGVNRFIEDQKAVLGEAFLSFVRFDSEYEEFRPLRALDEVEPLKQAEFVPRGSTALLDAVGRTLISLDHASKEYLPDKCIVVIVTDGKENASREFRREQIKQMIEAREESGKWTFIYLGADVSTFSEAGSLGIQLMNTARFINTAGGSVQLYATTSERIAALRMGAKDAGLGGVIPEAPEPSQVQRAEDSKLRSDASQGRPPGSKDDSQ